MHRIVMLQGQSRLWRIHGLQMKLPQLRDDDGLVARRQADFFHLKKKV